MFPRTKASSCGRAKHRPYTVWQRAFKVNQATNSMAFSVPTTTKPVVNANNGIHELRGGTHLLVAPYSGTSTADVLFGAVQLWYPIYDKVDVIKDSEDVAWIGIVAALLHSKIDADSDVSAPVGPIATTDNFCDVLIAANGTTQPYLDAFDADPTFVDPATPVTCYKLNSLGARYAQFYGDYDQNDPGRIGSHPMNFLFAEV
jgi:hypothetical protein